MKRNIVIAAVAVAALIGGGTATAIAVSGDDEAQVKRSSVRVSDDDSGRDDGVDVVDDKDGSDEKGAEGDRDDRNDSADDRAEAKAAEVTVADAIAAALKHRPGTAVSAELDDEDSNPLWDIDILTSGGAWHSVQVDPGTGEVLGSHTDRDDDGDDAAETERIRAALKGGSVTAAEAAEAAAAKGAVTSVDLDEDGRDQAWEVDTTAADGTGGDWRVNLDSGKVTADRSDD